MDDVEPLVLLKEINRHLLEENLELTQRVSKLKNYLSAIQDRHSLEICEYFQQCNSLYDTAEEYCFENVVECFWALVEYFGYADPMYKANDWHIYETEILEQNYRQSANENVVNDAAANASMDVINDAAATAATIAVNELVSVTASLDAAAHTDNIIINVDEN